MGDSTVGKLIIEIASSVDELKKGMKQAESSVEDLQKATTKADKNQQAFQKDIDKTGSSAKTSSKSVDTFTDSVEDAGDESSTSKQKVDKLTDSVSKDGTQSKTTSKQVDELTESLEGEGEQADTATEETDELTEANKRQQAAAEGASTANQQNATNIKKSGDNADKAKETLSTFKSVLGAIGVTVGITTVINAFKEMYEYIRDASLAYSDLKKQLGYSFGASVTTTSQQAMIDYELRNNTGVGVFGDNYQDMLSQIVVDTTKNFADASEEWQQSFVEQLITLANFGESVGVSDVAQLGDDMYTLSKKWGLSAEETSSVLEYMLDISNDTGLGIQDLVNDLLEFNDTADRLGLSITDTADLMGSAYHNRNLDDLMGMSNDTITRMYDTYAGNMRESYETALESGLIDAMPSETELTQIISAGFSDIMTEGFRRAFEDADEDELTAFLADSFGMTDTKTRSYAKALIEAMASDTTVSSNRNAGLSMGSELALAGGYTSETLEYYEKNILPGLSVASEALADRSEELDIIYAELKRENPGWWAELSDWLYNNNPLWGDALGVAQLDKLNELYGTNASGTVAGQISVSEMSESEQKDYYTQLFRDLAGTLGTNTVYINVNQTVDSSKTAKQVKSDTQSGVMAALQNSDVSKYLVSASKGGYGT